MLIATIPTTIALDWLSQEFRPTLFQRVAKTLRGQAVGSVQPKASESLAQREAQALRTLAHGLFRVDHRVSQELAGIACWHESQRAS